MARSMDMVVTDNLDTIIRLLESGPKLAQKYIDNPLTLRKKKIDLRYVLVVKSVIYIKNIILNLIKLILLFKLIIFIQLNLHKF